MERVLPYYQQDQTGHDLQHIQRVLVNSRAIMAGANLESREGQGPGNGHRLAADETIVTVIIWLHEVFDKKMAFDLTEADVENLLTDAGATREEIINIMHSIHHLSFSSNLDESHPLSIEGQLAQDADRLDAIGAIGIARCFHYGGNKGNPLYEGHGEQDEAVTPDNYYHGRSSVQHFYDKLLKIKDLMNTETGRRLAINRHRFMEDFLRELYQEIGAEKLEKRVWVD